MFLYKKFRKQDFHYDNLCIRLRLKDQQEREIVHILIDCCLQEKTYNPFYAYLSAKFCEYEKRFQVSTKLVLFIFLPVIQLTF